VRFDDIIGNTDIKLQLQIAGQAARIKNNPIPHTMFAGAAGCGKTTMSKALAINQLTDFIKIPPESMKSSKDVLDLADSLCVDGYTRQGELDGNPIKPSIVFFDEIHQMPLKGQEALGIAMEEWYVAHKSIYTGEVIEYWLPKFTVVGATTLVGKLSKPFRDRFKLTFRFETYSLEESIKIVKKHAELKGVNISEEGAEAVAKRGRGVPRIIISHLERVIDSMTVMGEEIVTSHTASSIFEIMGVDETGLTKGDIKILKALYESGQPIGIDTLSIILNESSSTIQSSIEPYLMQRSLLLRTGKGRVITQKGIEYLKNSGHVNTKRRFAYG
jgi:Holliday junction DNA helicase RuvB